MFRRRPRTESAAGLNRRRDPDGGTLVLLWQQNMSAILCEMQHDVTLDQPKAAVRLTHVRAGSPSTVA